VDGAAVATGGVEDVAAPARLASVADEVTGGSVLEAGLSEEVSDAVSVEDSDDDDESEDEDVFLDVLELDAFELVVVVLVGLTSDMLLLLSPLAAVCALRTEVFFVLQ